MEDIRNGDKILLSGCSGEDEIIANYWANNFTKTEVKLGDHGKFIDNTQPKKCYSCGQEVPHKVQEGEISINLYKFKDEELVELNKEYDLIFKIEHRNGEFGPTLVGGKRYVSSE